VVQVVSACFAYIKPWIETSVPPKINKLEFLKISTKTL
jgi:hypothetical protein